MGWDGEGMVGPFLLCEGMGWVGCLDNVICRGEISIMIYNLCSQVKSKRYFTIDLVVMREHVRDEVSIPSLI